MTSWSDLAGPDADCQNAGYLRVTDSDVTPGARYGYRLRISARGGDEWSGETWVDVPQWTLALEPARPNPATSSELEVHFVLPVRIGEVKVVSGVDEKLVMAAIRAALP